MPSKETAQGRFQDEFEQSIDSKHRITIPAVWRRGKPEQFILMAGRKDSCLEVMPPEEFNKAEEEATSHPTLTPRQRRQVKRAFNSGATRVTADEQGRFVLSDKLCERIGIKDAIVFVGVKETFEIWNPDHRALSAKSDESALDLAFELIGR